MILWHYIKYPVIALRIVYYYIFGSMIGRLFYPRYVFKSKNFQRPGGVGWKWVTKFFFTQKILGFNKHVPWPCSPSILVACPENIVFDMDDLNNFVTVGIYYQAIGILFIGKGTYIAPNVGIITENHNLQDPDRRAGAKDVMIGEKCWIGMNSIILPGIVLGNHTVVGAGSVVTKSFPNGYCVIGGNPAKIIKLLDRDKFVVPRRSYECYDYIPKDKFRKLKEKLNKDFFENDYE